MESVWSKSNHDISSHIVPWSDSNDEERLDVDNGILLSPNVDAFDDNGGLLISKNLSIDNIGNLDLLSFPTL